MKPVLDQVEVSSGKCKFPRTQMSPQQELTTALSLTPWDVTVHISVHCYFAGAALKCVGSKQIHVTICPLNPAERDNWLEWNSLKGQNTGSMCCVQWGLWSRQIQYLVQIRSAAQRETRKRSEENTAREMHYKTDLKWYEAPWCQAWGRRIFFFQHRARAPCNLNTKKPVYTHIQPCTWQTQRHLF